MVLALATINNHQAQRPSLKASGQGPDHPVEKIFSKDSHKLGQSRPGQTYRWCRQIRTGLSDCGSRRGI